MVIIPIYTDLYSLSDKILPQVNEWQNRPLKWIYPIVFFNGVVFNA